MTRTLVTNLLAIGLVIGAFASIPTFVGPDLPTVNRLAVQALALVFVAGWIVLLLRPKPAQAEGRIVWPFSSGFVVWAGIVVLVGGFWLWMPYADEGVLLACMVCQFCTTTVYILTTLQPPPSRGRIPLAPMALPASMALYLVVYPNRFTVPLGVFAVTYALVVALMQRFWQQSVDDAFAARRSAEAALVQVAAERDAKTRFLASASHDLAQPLQAARLSFDQATRGPLAPVQAAAARRVGWAFDSMEHQLTQMLDHLRLEAGVVAVDVRPTPLGPLIARLAELHEPSARLAGADLSVLPSRLSADADPALVDRIVGNFIANAVRHAKARRILVGVRPRGDRVRICVIDDGVGVAAVDRERLFEDYVQGSDHGDEIRGGFGLGLASARRMAGLMHASVGFSPEWAPGSSFWVDLPATGAKAGA